MMSVIAALSVNMVTANMLLIVFLVSGELLESFTIYIFSLSLCENILICVFCIDGFSLANGGLKEGCYQLVVSQ